MKHFPFIACLFLFISSCNRNDETIIVPVNNPFEVIPSKLVKNVLLEHFSEENQTISVDNNIKAATLKSIYSPRLIITNFHTKDFLETSYSKYIATSLGGLVTISRGAIDRLPGKHTSDNEDGVVLLSTKNWEGAILQSLQQKEAPLSIALQTGIEGFSNGYVNVYVAHKAAITGNTKMVVYLTEDAIEPVFQQGDTVGFLHNNVFRNIITDFDGDTIDLTSANEKGIIQVKKFANLDMSLYNMANLKVVAFVYIDDADYRKRQVLNVQEVNFFGSRYWDVE